MVRAAGLGLLAVAASCSQILGVDDLNGGARDAAPTVDASASDAAPGGFAISASLTSFDLHTLDTRTTVATVTNGLPLVIGPPTIAITGLAIGTATLEDNTCTASLGPGASCTVTVRLLGTAEGTTTFSLNATVAPDLDASVPLMMTVRPACPQTCGPDGTGNCCASAIVPGNASGATLSGEPFYRSYDTAADGMWPFKGNPATVSDFRLDRYEVTVGRFRQFVDAGMGVAGKAPSVGAGAHPRLVDSGWRDSWNGQLLADTATLKTQLKCDYQPTWTDNPGAGDALPIGCVTWYEAMAFCVWDGGYLPTEAEWNYAAAGGTEQRAYPWSDPADATPIDCSYANYNIGYPSQTGPFCVAGGAVAKAGATSPKGDGRWGHADLGGNVWEWVLDSYKELYISPCDDCADLSVESTRSERGGGLFNEDTNLRGARRNGYTPPTGRSFGLGMRCARRP